MCIIEINVAGLQFTHRVSGRRPSLRLGSRSGRRTMAGRRPHAA